MTNAQVDRAGIRLKLEFLCHTIIDMYRHYDRRELATPMAQIISMVATVGAHVIHLMRTPNRFDYSFEDRVRGRYVANRICRVFDAEFQRLYEQTVGLPITLRLISETKIIHECCETLTSELMDLYEGRTPWPQMPENLANYGRINQYTCDLGHQTITVDRDSGLTPLSIECPVCQNKAFSADHKCDQSLTPEYEFYKPTREEFEHMTDRLNADKYLDKLEFLAKGGLMGPRKITEVRDV